MSNIIPGTQEWLDIRRTLITATDMVVLMGAHKWGKTPRILYEQKLNGQGDYLNGAMARGMYLEEEARVAFEELTGHRVEPEFVISDDYVWACASLDGYNSEGVIVEIKSACKEDHTEALEGKVPDHYYPQIQWQMVVTGKKSAYYMSYHPGQEQKCAIVKCELDEEYAKRMIQKGQEFLQCLRDEIFPDLEAADCVPIEEEAFLEDEKKLANLMMQHDEVKEEMATLKERLFAQCKGHKSRGHLLAFTPCSRKGEVEYSKIPALQGIDLEEYRKSPVNFWRVKVL